MNVPPSHAPDPVAPADVVIVGAGISGTSALLRLLEAHREGRCGASPQLRVIVLERSADVYAGLPYGSRSGSSSLIVTPLREFLPDDVLPGFLDWLRQHQDRILADSDSLGISGSWVGEHADEIRAGRWEDLFIPRRLFGLFLRELVADELARTPDAEVEVVTGEAADLRADGSDWRLGVRSPAGDLTLSAGTVILSLGSPPKQSLTHTSLPVPVGRFVEDTHATSIDELLTDLGAHLRSLEPGMSPDVLLVGANADALELLHAAHRADIPKAWDRRVMIVAPHGTPDAWTVRPPHGIAYRSQHLATLAATTADADLTASGIYAAIERDVEDAIAHGFSEQDTVADLKHITGDLLDRLPHAEQQSFVDAFGNLINRFSRPTGGDYQRVASTLLEDGRISIVRGAFRRAVDGPTGWTVTVGSDTGERELDGTFGVVVNCAGFQDIDDTTDPFLRAVLDDGVVRSTPSRRGILVDATYQAAPGVFVVGPLLAGNLNDHLRVWHLESCRRIMSMSEDIARAVTARLAERHPTAG